jgi:hypothetical protein
MSKKKSDKEIIREQQRYITQMEKDRRDMINNYEKFRKELESKREYLKIASDFENKLIKCYQQAKNLKKQYDDSYKDNIDMVSEIERLVNENANLSDDLNIVEEEIESIQQKITNVKSRVGKNKKRKDCKNCWEN